MINPVALDCPHARRNAPGKLKENLLIFRCTLMYTQEGWGKS